MDTKKLLTEATARPWRVADQRPLGVNVYGSIDGGPVAEVQFCSVAGTPQDWANAALLVRAVNSFEAMREALRDLLRFVEEDGPDTRDAAHAALALADGDDTSKEG